MADDPIQHPAGMIPVSTQPLRRVREPDVADRVMAMQRRNLAAAAAAGGSGSRTRPGQNQPTKSRAPPASRPHDDFSRALPGQPSSTQVPSQRLYNPAQGTSLKVTVQPPRRTDGPQESSMPPPRDRHRSEFDRERTRLYEASPGPSRGQQGQAVRRDDGRHGHGGEYRGSDSEGQLPSRHRDRGKGRAPPTQNQQRKLFDPRVHDPVRFSTASSAQPLPPQQPSSSTVRTVPRTAEEEADRERERRRRREGSERGVGSVSSGVSKKDKKDRDADGRSKGSRSSEGSESFKDRERGRGKGETGIMTVLRESYKNINSLELQLVEIHKKMSADPALAILVYLANRDGTTVNERAMPPLNPLEEGNAWVELIARHKRLADAHHDFLNLSLDPQLPSSLHGLPIRYNIPARLWQTGFHLILERLRHSWAAAASSTSSSSMDRNGRNGMSTPRDPKAAQRMLDILTDFIYDAYTFYTSLLEEQALAGFKTAWIEALGDLARYRMAIASHLDAADAQSVQPTKAVVYARIDDDEDNGPQPAKASIGADVAQAWDVEDRETWRTTARDWYAMGITEKPGEGRLHHHLALLCRDVHGEEARALYHFSKSLTTSHPFRTSRESILPLFDGALQSQRSMPDANAMDLFVRLHGMIFTRIQLDDFDDVFARFMERLEEDARIDSSQDRPKIAQIDWLMMATTNLAGVLQYGSDEGLVKRAMAEQTATRKGSKQPATAPQAIMLHADSGANGINEDSGPGTDPADDGEDDGDDEPAGLGPDSFADEEHRMPVLKSLSIADHGETEPESFPMPLTNALQLAFTTFEFSLKQPTKMLGYHEVVNPYIPAFLTFLATVLRQPAVISLLEQYIPWLSLVHILNSVPRTVEFRPELVTKLVVGPPNPEDWCLRGMEWVGRRVYERGFWKGKQSSQSGLRSSGPPQPRLGERLQSELDVLQADFDAPVDMSDGIVEEVEGTDQTDGPAAITVRRWRRIAWAAGVIARNVEGLYISYEPNTCRAGQVKIEPNGALDRKLKAWSKARAMEAEEERARRNRISGVQAREDVDEGYGEEVDSGDDDGDEELQELRERRRHLQSLLGSKFKTGGSKAQRGHHRSLDVVQGYTMLVFDTNVLLSALKLFSRVVESGQWTVIVPLPVITELDGLAKSAPPLGPAAAAAISYLESHIRSHSLSLKVQTSRGNYLSDLVIRTESIPLNSASADDVARSMDDHILNVAVFQEQHHVDRSALLHGRGGAKSGTKVLLLTFDRNLRVRARARGVEAADEREMAKVLGTG